jgi:hypothetical protein
MVVAKYRLLARGAQKRRYRATTAGEWSQRITACWRARLRKRPLLSHYRRGVVAAKHRLLARAAQKRRTEPRPP